LSPFVGSFSVYGDGNFVPGLLTEDHVLAREGRAQGMDARLRSIEGGNGFDPNRMAVCTDFEDVEWRYHSWVLKGATLYHNR